MWGTFCSMERWIFLEFQLIMGLASCSHGSPRMMLSFPGGQCRTIVVVLFLLS